MSFKSFLAGPFGGAVVGGGIGAALGAASGATGAAILQASGYSGYVVSEAVNMGAIGTGVFYSISGGVRGALASCGLFKTKDKEKSSNITGSIVGHTSSVVLGGLTGYGIMNAAGSTVMELAQTAAAFAVGGAVTAIPASCALLCICAPLIVAAAYYTDKTENTETSAPAPLHSIAIQRA